MTVKVRKISTQTTVTRLVDGSILTDMMDWCHALSQTDTTCLGYDDHSLFADGSDEPIGRVTVFQIIDSGPGADDTAVRLTALNVDCMSVSFFKIRGQFNYHTQTTGTVFIF